MTRSPCRDSACRLLGVASALLLNLAFPTHSTLAEDLTPARINAATSAVDSAMIKANTATSRDWPTIGLDYAETRIPGGGPRDDGTEHRHGVEPRKNGV